MGRKIGGLGDDFSNLGINLLQVILGHLLAEQALAQIIEMFEAEIARPTDTGTTAPRSQ